MKKEVNAEVINSNKSKFLVILEDFKDILKYAAIAVLCIFVLCLVLLLGWKLWS